MKITRQARALMVVVALAVVATVSSYLTRFIDHLPDNSTPLPFLAAGLSPTNARQDFADRVRKQFPLGSSEQALMFELWSEGFGHPGEGSGHRRWASAERRDLVCGRAWTVTWTADDGGHLTAVDGTYIPSCS